MLVPFSKSNNAMIKVGDTVLDLGNRPWLFSAGFKPALVKDLPEGEIYVKKLATDARPKTFNTAMFPDIEFREIVEEKPKPKAETKPKKTFTTERKGTRTGRFDARKPHQSNEPRHAKT